MRARTLIPLTLTAGAAAAGYAALVERNWFVLRRYEIPVLAPGTAPMRVLHISDAHLTPARRRLAAWMANLDELDPDLVVNTGDCIAHPEAVPHFLNALGPLLRRPGVFVFGSNDLYAPEPRNPARYLFKRTHGKRLRSLPTLPWEKLRDGMTESGWLDLNNNRARLEIGDARIALAGVHDSHIARDRYAQIEGTADPAAAIRIGIMHSPEPRLLDQFAADRYDLLLAGHTHGGQLRLPRYGALVTNCGLDRQMARGLHRYPGPSQPSPWLHVSAGLGTSPWAPARVACRPEASLLTLVAR